MNTVVWILSGKPNGSFTVKGLRDQSQVFFFVLIAKLAQNYLESAISAKMDLNVDPLSVLTYKLEGMTRVTVHVVITVRDAAVREQNQNLMNTLGILRKIVLKKCENERLSMVYMRLC